MSRADLVHVWTGNQAASLPSFVEEHATELAAHLTTRGAVLFRGFRPISDQEFTGILNQIGGQVLEYSERSSPRREISDRVYSSTEYPADQEIFFHNENSYQVTWPSVLGFLCRKPAEAGGETPLADCRAVLRRIDEDIVAKFVEHGWSYVRNFYPGLGLPWQEVFQTSDPSKVDEYCSDHRLKTSWIGSSQLRVSSDARPAVKTHPTTGEQIWFNHAAFFHYSTLPAEIADVLYGGMDPEDLPSNSYLGNGETIDADAVSAIREAYREESQPVSWQRDDVLLIDNMLIAHGRRPFTGDRRLSVAMAGVITEGPRGLRPP